MRHYNKILYVNYGVSNEKEGLKQAINLAKDNQAPLTILTLTPTFPRDLGAFKDEYEQAIQEKVNDTVSRAFSELSIDENTIDLSFEMKVNKTPAIVVIKTVLQNGFDLIVKEADIREGNNGYKAFDMDLLRKSPVPVWLCRPKNDLKEDINVAVAIDPESTEEAAERLSERLLQLSSTLANQYNQELKIVSCWDFELENSLRENVFFKMPAEAVDEKVRDFESRHHQALIQMIDKSGIDTAFQIYHLRGHPADRIPLFVKENDIDVLVMGSVARTGIAGFMIGNTAENIIQQLSCSLLTLKPHGFVSPVKA